MSLRPGASLSALILLAISTHARAEAPPKPGDRLHDGFYLDADFGGGVMNLDSEATPSNGFRQRLPTTGIGAVLGASLAPGFTLRGTGVVLGLRLNMALVPQMTLETDGKRYSPRAFGFESFGAIPFVRFFPNPRGNFHFGGGVGVTALVPVMFKGSNETDELLDGQGGVTALLDVGHGVWINPKASTGGELRLKVGRLGDGAGPTTLVTTELLWYFSVN